MRSVAPAPSRGAARWRRAGLVVALVGAALVIAAPPAGAQVSNPLALYPPNWTIGRGSLPSGRGDIVEWIGEDNLVYGAAIAKVHYQGNETDPLRPPTVGNRFYVHVEIGAVPGAITRATFELSVLLPAGITVPTLSSTDVVCTRTNASYQVIDSTTGWCGDPIPVGVYQRFPDVVLTGGEIAHYWFPVVSSRTKASGLGPIQFLARQKDGLQPNTSINPAISQVTPDVKAAIASVPSPPQAVRAAARSAAAAIAWTAPGSTGSSGLTGYTARAYSTSTGGTALASCAAGASAAGCNLTGLTNGRAYWVDVTAQNATGPSSPSTPRVAVTPVASATTPGVPQAVRAAPANQSAVATWAPPTSNGGSAVTSYRATAYTAASGGTAAGSCTSAGLTCTITGLTNATTYYLSATATNGVGTSAASAPRIPVTPAVPVAVPASPVPGRPTTVKAVPGSRGGTVTWVKAFSNGPLPIIEYRVSVWNGSGVLVTRCISPTPSCNVTGLADGGTYFVDVRAVNLTGESIASFPRVPLQPASVPTAPTSPTATAGFGAATVRWAAPATGGSPVLSYRATAFSAATGGTAVRSCDSPTPGCTIGGLSNGTAYFVAVTARNLAGTGASSPRARVVPTATRTVPSQPTALVARSVSGTSTELAWTAPAATGGSTVSSYRADLYASATSTTSIGSCTSTTATTCTVGSLTAGTAYYASVVARNATGASAASARTLFRAGVPTTITGVVDTGPGIQLSWAAPTVVGASSVATYTARVWSAPSGGVLVATCSPPSGLLTCPATPIHFGTTYYVDVIALNGAGTSPAPAVRAPLSWS